MNFFSKNSSAVIAFLLVFLSFILFVKNTNANYLPQVTVCNEAGYTCDYTTIADALATSPGEILLYDNWYTISNTIDPGNTVIRGFNPDIQMVEYTGTGSAFHIDGGRFAKLEGFQVRCENSETACIDMVNERRGLLSRMVIDCRGADATGLRIASDNGDSANNWVEYVETKNCTSGIAIESSGGFNNGNLFLGIYSHNNGVPFSFVRSDSFENRHNKFIGAYVEHGIDSSFYSIVDKVIRTGWFFTATTFDE